MPVVALALYGLLIAVPFALRIAIQIHKTGSAGLNRFRGAPGSAEWWAATLFVLGVVAAPLGPILILLGVLEPISLLNTTAVHVAGIALAVAGILLIFLIQLEMGDSWRIGVDSKERTELVTGGFFAIVRNPIYVAFAPMAIGILLIVPTVFLFVDIAIVALSLEMQVRIIEEPYLLRLHGDAYRSYASRVGRFLPGVGLIAPPEPESAAVEAVVSTSR